MRAAFISVPYDTRTYRCGESLGLRYVAAAAMNAGVSVRVYEMSQMEMSEALLMDELSREPPDFLGFSVLFSKMIHPTLDLATKLRNKFGKPPLIAIGGHVTRLIGDTLAEYPAVDVVALGEAENYISDLIAAGTNEKYLTSVPGLLVKRGSEIVSTGCAKPILDLDALPLPYRDKYSRVLGDPHYTVLSSRGCPKGCVFCAVNRAYQPLGSPKWRSRSITSVLKELTYLQRELDAQSISFVDDNFLGSSPEGLERARSLALAIINSDLHLSWSMECRADDVASEDFRLMALSGLSHVFVGIEAGTDEVLKAFAKQCTVADMKRAIGILRDLGIDFTIGFIMFHHLTTLDLIRANLEFLKEMNLLRWNVISTRMSLYPGMRFAERLARRGEVRRKGFEYEVILRPEVEALWQIYRYALTPFAEVEIAIDKAKFAAATQHREISPSIVGLDSSEQWMIYELACRALGEVEKKGVDKVNELRVFFERMARTGSNDLLRELNQN